jgi:hypothetical protein
MRVGSVNLLAAGSLLGSSLFKCSVQMQADVTTGIVFVRIYEQPE